jgi:hypothetical protein
MTNWISWDIEDSDGENPLGVPGEFEFNVAFDYDPGDVVDQRANLADHDSPAVATITGAECVAVKLSGEEPRQPTVEETEMLEEWFMSILDVDSHLRRQIETCGLDQLCVEPYCPEWDE